MSQIQSKNVSQIKSNKVSRIKSNPLKRMKSATAVSVWYPHQDTIYLYDRFHKENLKQDSFNSFMPKVFPYFYTILISNCKFEITTVPQIALKDNLINLNLILR